MTAALQLLAGAGRGIRADTVPRLGRTRAGEARTSPAGPKRRRAHFPREVPRRCPWPPRRRYRRRLRAIFRALTVAGDATVGRVDVSAVAALKRAALRWLQPLVPGGRAGVLVLAYHLVGGESRSPVDLPRPVFERQMAELSDRAKVLSLEEALLVLESREVCPANAVLLTFDDAYANFFDEAWPVLQRHGLPATLFVPVSFIDKRLSPPIRGTSFPPLSWRQLEELAGESLCTLGSHSRTHPDLRRLSGSALRDEIEGSKRDLKARLGVEVRSFCYPGALFSKEAERLVAECYDIGFAAGGRRVRPQHWRPAVTPRLPVRCDMPESLVPILRSSIWIEEAVADSLRRWRGRPV